MKYGTVKLKNGKYAVASGTKKYFPHTVSETEKEAKQLALIESMKWYQFQIDKAFSELEKISETNDYGEVKLVGSDFFCTKGDLLA